MKRILFIPLLRTLPHRTKTLPKPAPMQNFPRERSGISHPLLPAVSEMLPDYCREYVQRIIIASSRESFNLPTQNSAFFLLAAFSRHMADLTTSFSIPVGSAKLEICAEILQEKFSHGTYSRTIRFKSTSRGKTLRRASTCAATPSNSRHGEPSSLI
mgnify:FL=1